MADYPMVEVAVDLTTPPGLGNKTKLLDPGKPVSDIFLNGVMPPGINLRLLYGNNAQGILFGPGGLQNHTEICPHFDTGLYAAWDVAAPGTIVRFMVAFAQGSSAGAA